jgi:SAM-dependent methyltransferase
MVRPRFLQAISPPKTLRLGISFERTKGGASEKSLGTYPLNQKEKIMNPPPAVESTNRSPKGLPFWDPRKALEYPPIYNLFQRAVGADKPRRAFIAEHIAPLGRARVLEIGCGPATNCAWMPRDVEYVGCDHSEAYIAYARNRYGDRAEFFSVPVGQLRDLGLKPFKAVIALALLHHLTDAEVLTLCDEVLPLLDKSGSLITGDPCFVTGMKRFERFITSCDRGHYVRYPEQYRELLAKKFPVVNIEIRRSRGMLIPNTGAIIKASLS